MNQTNEVFFSSTESVGLTRCHSLANASTDSPRRTTGLVSAIVTKTSSLLSVGNEQAARATAADATASDR